MASDKKKFEIAQDKWRNLLEERLFSVAPDCGKIAIICSYLTDYSGAMGGQKDIAEIEAFAAEANALKKRARQRKRAAEIFEDANSETMKNVLADKEFTDIITIGHGALAFLYMPNGHRKVPLLRFSEYSSDDTTPYKQEDNRVDWFDISQATTHLKTGAFVQRHCGHAVRELSVPLGLFALADPTKVVAPLNTVFIPKSLDDTENEKLKPVICDDTLPKYRQIKSLFSKEKFLETITGSEDEEDL